MKKCPTNLLATFVNVVFLYKRPPFTWKHCKTILLLKEGHLFDPANWRPITISSALQRLFHRILASKLSEKIELCCQQRGFQPLDGTLDNLLILEHYIKSRNSAGKSNNVISIDIRKALITSRMASPLSRSPLLTAALSGPSSS